MKSRLVVYVPGFRMTLQRWDPLIKRLQAESDFVDTKWKGWDHDIGLFSTHSVMSKAVELCAVIDSEWKLAEGFDEIILVGHSLGGILVRQCYLIASGCYKNEPKCAWAKNIKRIVLLASPNRGIDQSKFRIRLYDLITRFLGVMRFRPLIGEDLISGSDSMINLRLAWIKHMASLPANQRPSITQILGTVDSLVTRRDSMDLEQFPNATHVSIPDVNHRQLPLMDEGPNAEMRYRFIKDALVGTVTGNSDPIPINSDKQHIIFVLHGIRAGNRGWVQALEERIRDVLPDASVITPSYGYLSALEFVVPFLHRRPIRVFQQLYCDSIIENPNARVDFVGHSNGTYILGHSLRALSAMKFDNVVLTGSVLPRDFEWREFMKGTSPQVKKLRNDCANADWPVGILCKGLSGIFRNDIGTGGYEGFHHDDDNVFQYWFHKGGHSAALSEDNLPNIARFLAQGDGTSKPSNLVEEDLWFSLLSKFASVIFWALVGCLVIVFGLSLATQHIYVALGILIGLVVLAIILKQI
ncbi:alpha/beta hydrolase [Saccharophagus sp. K07]|uniref:esterase/lipase family protein n=1 Tax=Saccharophagus sp. K07 TaxID=2283636 RepID=UPI001651B2CB|nr:alpha/beta hydrolase [Saccharophagus sp. K07]MBC6904515.1 alpha/beta hydrolase [Saccharophagus sp. K07]